MAVTLVATAGATTANSYVTVAEALALLALHPYAGEMVDDDSDDIAKLLIMATQVIDEQFEFDGTPANFTQALAFPRWGLTTVSGDNVSTTTIPDLLKRATVELALQLRAANRTADNDVETQGIRGLSVGPISVQFSGLGGAKVIPDRVEQMLQRWGHLVGPHSGTFTLTRA